MNLSRYRSQVIVTHGNTPFIVTVPSLTGHRLSTFKTMFDAFVHCNRIALLLSVWKNVGTVRCDEF